MIFREDKGGGYTQVACGHNHIPGKEGAELAALLADKDAKYAHVIHAEVDAIAFAARRGKPTDGLTMVCPWAACLGCAAVILQAGITRLVIHKQRTDLTHEHWKPKVEAALAWLADRGVDIIAYDGEVATAAKILVNGQEWQP